MDKLVDVPRWMRNGWIIAGIAVDFQRKCGDSSGHYWGYCVVYGWGDLF